MPTYLLITMSNTNSLLGKHASEAEFLEPTAPKRQRKEEHSEVSNNDVDFNFLTDGTEDFKLQLQNLVNQTCKVLKDTSDPLPPRSWLSRHSHLCTLYHQLHSLLSSAPPDCSKLT